MKVWDPGHTSEYAIITLMHRISLPEFVMFLLSAMVLRKVDLNHVHTRFYEQRFPHFKKHFSHKQKSSFQLKWKRQETREHRKNNDEKRIFPNEQSCLLYNVRIEKTKKPKK